MLNNDSVFCVSLCSILRITLRCSILCYNICQLLTPDCHAECLTVLSVLTVDRIGHGTFITADSGVSPGTSAGSEASADASAQQQLLELVRKLKTPIGEIISIVVYLYYCDN